MNDRQKVTVLTLQISDLSVVHNRFYGSSKLKNWMCELRMHVFANLVAHNYVFFNKCCVLCLVFMLSQNYY